MDLPSELSRYRDALEGELRSTLAEGSPRLLYQMMRYHMGWEDEAGNPTYAPGKALRPSLSLWACQAVGGDWLDCLPAAAALELVHEFSLIHDDIQDGDTERRHRPTVWRIWGQAQAINAGDAMLTVAHLCLLGMKATRLSQEKVIQAGAALNQAVLSIIEGQCLDLSFENTLEVSVDAYMEMIGKKTAELFRSAFCLGALIGCDDAERQDAMSKSGGALGLAFQVVDDTLGIWGQRALTGKPAADILHRKKSLPIVYALERSRGRTARSLVEIYSKEHLDDRDAQTVLSILEDLKAKEYCLSVARGLSEEAILTLRRANISSQAQREATAIFNFLLDREF